MSGSASFSQSVRFVRRALIELTLKLAIFVRRRRTAASGENVFIFRYPVAQVDISNAGNRVQIERPVSLVREAAPDRRDQHYHHLAALIVTPKGERDHFNFGGNATRIFLGVNGAKAAWARVGSSNARQRPGHLSRLAEFAISPAGDIDALVLGKSGSDEPKDDVSIQHFGDHHKRQQLGDFGRYAKVTAKGHFCAVFSYLPPVFLKFLASFRPVVSPH